MALVLKMTKLLTEHILNKKFLIYFVVVCFCLLLFLFLTFDQNSVSNLKKSLLENSILEDEQPRTESEPDLIENKCKYGPKGPRILCAVFTTKSSHKTKLMAVHNTWAKRYL